MTTAFFTLQNVFQGDGALFAAAKAFQHALGQVHIL
jgi:hypothetical protein